MLKRLYFFGRHVIILALVTSIFMLQGPTTAHATDPDFLSLGLGISDYNDDKTAAEGRFEYRSNIELSIFRPFSGFMMTSDRAMYGYGGLFVDFFFGRRIVVQPSLAVGAYSSGAGKNLGHWIQFSPKLEVAWRFDDRSRLGLSVAHMSNASLNDKNPGTESVLLTYSLPFDRIAKHNLWE